MLQLNAAQIVDYLPWSDLIHALQQGFQQGCKAPLRHHHTIEVPNEPDATLLLMPAWLPGEFLGVKLVSVFPGNGARQQAAINGSYLLSSARTGELLALLDGTALTARRTAAASALAASYLARTDAQELLMVGAGALAPNLIAAHASVRPLQRVQIWARELSKAQLLAEQVQATHPQLKVSASSDLAHAAATADIISCATLSRTPLIRGEWLKAGAHVDLVGGFTPDMREADDVVIQRAQVFVDTREGATHEAGDIVQPLRAGILQASAIQADLYELCRNQHSGRDSAEAITLFKSVGASLEDLVAAVLAYQRATAVTPTVIPA